MFQVADGRRGEEAAIGGQRAGATAHEQPQRRLRTTAGSGPFAGQRSQTLQIRNAADGADVHRSPGRIAPATLTAFHSLKKKKKLLNNYIVMSELKLKFLILKTN